MSSKNIGRPTKNHNLLIFTKEKKGEWDRLVKLTSREKWEPTLKETGTPVEIDGDHGNPLEHGHGKLRQISLPPNFCPFCGRTDIPAEDRRAVGLFLMAHAHPEIHLKEQDAVSHITCDGCAERLAWPDEYDTTLILGKGLAKRSFRSECERNIVGYIKAQQMSGVTGAILGDETRREKFKENDEVIV